MSAEGHAFTVKLVFPRIGRVRSTDEILQALGVKSGDRESTDPEGCGWPRDQRR